jgi:hypothetical protein
MSNIIRAFATAALVLVGSGASFGSEYLQRTDTVTLGAGNAKDVNAAIHVIDPWPRHVGNVRIRGDGDRMVGAVQRYKKGGGQRNGGTSGASASPGTSSSPSGLSPAGGLSPATPGAIAPSMNE